MQKPEIMKEPVLKKKLISQIRKILVEEALRRKKSLISTFSKECIEEVCLDIYITLNLTFRLDIQKTDIYMDKASFLQEVDLKTRAYLTNLSFSRKRLYIECHNVEKFIWFLDELDTRNKMYYMKRFKILFFFCLILYLLQIYFYVRFFYS